MTTISKFPAYYDVAFIIEKAGLTNHYGAEMRGEQYWLQYQFDDYAAVTAAVEAYPVEYAEIMRPGLIHGVSQTRERKLATFSFNGMNVPLDLTTSANLTGAAVGLTRDPSRVAINWSLGKGQFVTIPRDTMLALADAAFAFVNDCFDAQKVIVEQIQSAPTIEELRAMDIANHPAWPT